MIIAGILMATLCAFIFKNMNIKKVLLVLDVYFLLSEIFKQVLLFYVNGYIDLWYFPFQLCSLPLYLIPLYLFTGKKFFLDFMSDFSLLGGFFAFFDTSGMQYGLSILTINSYLWHFLLIYLGIFLKIKEKESDFKKEIFLYLATILIATLINISFKSANMFYISPYHNMNQVIFMDIGLIIGQNKTKFFYCFMQLFGAYLINTLCKSFH